jgi:biopolymer transport protein ExbD
MPIYAPGKRDRHNKKLGGARKVVAILSLTAMVDMFTVIVVFLLQNYKTTGAVLFLPKEVQLPLASATKELKPAHVVTISNQFVFLDQTPVVNFTEVKEQRDWMVRILYQKLVEVMRDDEKKYRENLKTQIKKVVGNQPEQDTIKQFKKVTVQADKKIDFLTIKKIMYTVTEAGAEEINFAVITEDDKPHPKM